ncbi:hypothetical protein L3X38_018332 [Prunus dulcis]|uniref:Integrase catalytic domain-containing protein n=1 Tax=Prunus dulcis TaxID=3755 RepID=A0AAD4W8S9_PRUDU|nr:hypothetical protein L3X38_018332 [Prunus dulcis]
MSGDKSVFSSLSPFDRGTVTFGGGHKSQVVGKGTVCIPGLPELKNVRCVEGLHMDLVGPIQTLSLGGKKYIIVMVDDFSWFTWVSFLREKSKTFLRFKFVCHLLQKEKMTSHLPLVRIRTDHGSEFENSQFLKFCEEMGSKHEFSAPITPQQNGVVERKNRVLVEMARVMLNSKNLAKHFWAEAGIPLQAEPIECTTVGPEPSLSP